MDGWYERVYFICGISANHMLDGLVTSWVILHPSVRLQNMLVQDNDVLAISYEPLNLPPAHDGICASLR